MTLHFTHLCNRGYPSTSAALKRTLYQVHNFEMINSEGFSNTVIRKEILAEGNKSM